MTQFNIARFLRLLMCQNYCAENVYPAQPFCNTLYTFSLRKAFYNELCTFGKNKITAYLTNSNLFQLNLGSLMKRRKIDQFLYIVIFFCLFFVLVNISSFYFKCVLYVSCKVQYNYNNSTTSVLKQCITPQTQPQNLQFQWC